MSQYCFSQQEIANFVLDNNSILSKMTSQEIDLFADENDIDSPQEFYRFKRALLEIDIDYEALKKEQVKNG